MLKYKLVKFNHPSSDFNGMIYARAAYDETIDLNGLVNHMASHNSPFSKGTISGVLKDMVTCIRELLLQSKKVKLDDLAIFSLVLKSTFASTVDKFSTSTNIKGARVSALGTGEFAYKQVQLDAKFTEQDEYTKEA